jgi:hypothetical protein
MNKQNKKVMLVVFIQLVTAATFIVGAKWASRTIYIYYQSYFADIVIPFAFYFLLTTRENETRFLNVWWKRALVILALTATSESLQYFGIYALARVFDPIDYVMYVVGVFIAVMVDRKIFSRVLPFWD